MKNRDEFPVIDRTFELIKWYAQHIAGFPRAHRYGLGQRIEQRLYSILEQLITARFREAGGKAAALDDANLQLEILRFLTRLAHEQKLIAGKSHEHASREVNDIGRMVGGWLKQQKQASTKN